MSRTMKELREAQGLTYKALAARVNSALRDWIEDVLRSQGEDMRVAWRQRDEYVERFRVVPETLERWEKVGFGVQRGTRAMHTF
jgi:transcriptional regulator with XRE-family HTH domain